MGTIWYSTERTGEAGEGPSAKSDEGLLLILLFIVYNIQHILYIYCMDYVDPHYISYNQFNINNHYKGQVQRSKYIGGEKTSIATIIKKESGCLHQ